MKGAVLMLVAVCACKEFYGLEDTRLPPIDALPTECPPEGRPPKLSPKLIQSVAQECDGFHFNGDGSLATATCQAEITVGSRDKLLTSKIANTTTLFYTVPRPSARHRRVYVRRHNNTTFVNDLAAFEEVSGTWSPTGAVGVTYSSEHRLSTVFRGATGDRMIVIDATRRTLTEYEELSSGMWVQQGVVHPSPTGFAENHVFAVTTDGLRVVFLSNDFKQHLYAYRPDLESWFGEPKPLEGAPPNLFDSQLTDDCTRLYYTGLDSIFYSQQINE